MRKRAARRLQNTFTAVIKSLPAKCTQALMMKGGPNLSTSFIWPGPSSVPRGGDAAGFGRDDSF